MGKCSVESAEDCPASTHGRSRFAGVICAATCFMLFCSIIIYTMQWERGSGIENRQQMESLYELKNIVDGLKGKLDKYNSSTESVDEKFYEVRERLNELTENMDRSQNSVTDLNDTVLKFKTSLDELKEIFGKFKNEMDEMKRKQIKMKEDLDKFQSNNNGSSNQPEVDKNTRDVPTKMSFSQNHSSFIDPRPISRETFDELITLDDAINNLRYLAVPSLRFKNNDLKAVLEDLETKNYSSKMENCQVRNKEFEEIFVTFKEKVGILKSGFGYPSMFLNPSVEKILVLKAKDIKLEVMINEIKSLFTSIQSSLDMITENIDEIEKKLKLMVDCVERNARGSLSLESIEQIPEENVEEIDLGKLIGVFLPMTGDLEDIKRDINTYKNRIAALVTQMDNADSFHDMDNPRENKSRESEESSTTPVSSSDWENNDRLEDDWDNEEDVTEKSDNEVGISPNDSESEGIQGDLRYLSSGLQPQPSQTKEQNKGSSEKLVDEASRVDNQERKPAVEDEETPHEDEWNDNNGEENGEDNGDDGDSETVYYTVMWPVGQVSWTEAKEMCEAKEMRLAVITNRRQQEKIKMGIWELGIEQRSFWISKMSKYSQSPLTASDKPSDTWSQNNNDTEYCPFIDFTTTGGSPCSDKKYFICEKSLFL